MREAARAIDYETIIPQNIIIGSLSHIHEF